MNEDEMSLADFVKLPSTVAFTLASTDPFLRYVKGTNQIKTGITLESGMVVAYANQNNIATIFRDLGSDFTAFFPKILSPLGKQSNDGAGITPVLEHPYLGLSGKGVIIGIVDTGIDYTKDVFQNANGGSKIISIWDQSIDGARSEELYYGAEFSREDIERALQAEDPYSVVPSKDVDGHGTFLASVAAGSQVESFIGAAPEAELVVVKLRRAHPFYIKRFLLPSEEKNLYASTDFILGANYVFQEAKKRNMPVVLCVGMGSNMSGHDGNTPLEEFLSRMAQHVGVAVVAAAGNESNAKHHTQGKIAQTGDTDVISIRVGEQMTSFTMSLFGASYDKISVGVTSPTGEVISRVPFKVGLEFENELTIDRTVIRIGYFKDINTVILVSFENAKEGIWEVRLYGDTILSGEYFAWLPITGQVSPWVEFMRPVPEYTIVFPATALRAIACGAFNSKNNTLYVASSWGPTRLPRMAPDFVAPGVGVVGIYPTGPGIMTGTSTAAATTAGAAAILLEWGLVQKNLLALDGDTVRLLLISGCTRDEGILYPNTRWGFGKLNLYGTFFNIKESSVIYDQNGGIL